MTKEKILLNILGVNLLRLFCKMARFINKKHFYLLLRNGLDLQKEQPKLLQRYFIELAPEACTINITDLYFMGNGQILL